MSAPTPSRPGKRFVDQAGNQSSIRVRCRTLPLLRWASSILRHRSDGGNWRRGRQDAGGCSCASADLLLAGQTGGQTTHYTIDCCFLSPPNELAATFGTSRSTASPCRHVIMHSETDSSSHQSSRPDTTLHRRATLSRILADCRGSTGFVRATLETLPPTQALRLSRSGSIPLRRKRPSKLPTGRLSVP